MLSLSPMSVCCLVPTAGILPLESMVAPPSTLIFSQSTTFAPCSAALSAAQMPAPPPPITSTSVSVCCMFATSLWRLAYLYAADSCDEPAAGFSPASLSDGAHDESAPADATVTDPMANPLSRSLRVRFPMAISLPCALLCGASSSARVIRHYTFGESKRKETLWRLYTSTRNLRFGIRPRQEICSGYRSRHASLCIRHVVL